MGDTTGAAPLLKRNSHVSVMVKAAQGSTSTPAGTRHTATHCPGQVNHWVSKGRDNGLPVRGITKPQSLGPRQREGGGARFINDSSGCCNQILWNSMAQKQQTFINYNFGDREIQHQNPRSFGAWGGPFSWGRGGAISVCSYCRRNK